MTTFIGFLELAGWMLAVLGLAAAITYVVVKLFPGRADAPKAPDASEAS